VREARSNKKKKSKASRSSSSVDVTHFGHSATIIASGAGVEYHAMGFEFTVPAGGIRPKHGKAIMMFKPEGVVFRSRTYTKHQGEVIKRGGWLRDAVLEAFDASSSGWARHNYTKFALDIAMAAAIDVCKHIVKDIENQKHVRAHYIIKRS